MRLPCDFALKTFLFAGNIWYGGTIEELNNNSVDLLREQVLSRKNYLQNEMIQRWSNLTKYEHDVQTGMESFLREKNITPTTLKQEPHLAFEFLERGVHDAIFAIRQRMVTGAFIVLMTENGKQHPGVYIRDSDPLFNPNDNSDLSIEVGPSTVARKAEISLGMGWEPRFTLSEEDDATAFYYKPLKAAQKNWGNDISDLGYWSKPFKLNKYSVEAITYSVPLIDTEGNPYGVIGIELTLDYLRKLLYYDEIADNKQGAYVLGIADDKDMVFENIVSSGPIFSKIFGDSTRTIFDEKTEYDNIYRLNNGQNNLDSVYGCVHYLNLYNNNTPFQNEKWALIGIVEEITLFKPASQILLYVAISLLSSFIVGMVGVVLVGIWFVNPITTLVRNVRNSDPEKSIVLDKTNIAEIDDLAWSIETLSNKVAESADKLSKIIGMMEIPIGAFEHNSKEDRVFCTAAFFDLAGIKNMEGETAYISSTYFYEILKDLQKHPEPDMEDIYRYEKDEGSIRWLRIKIQDSSGKMLGVVEDVSREVKEKRKIEYERDHDLLTHLLNRRAFQTEVTKRLGEQDVETAAFIMWDLDNLNTSSVWIICKVTI